MSGNRIEVTVGQRRGDFRGKDHLALQGAVDAVAGHGGGTVRILRGTYTMANSLFLRSGVRLCGEGDATVLVKCASASTRLVGDTDWYDTTVAVKDPQHFRVGGAILLRGKSPHFDKMQVVKRTVTGVDGNTIHIDRDPRENFWLETKPEAATLFPVVTASEVHDIVIESLCIDGNREQNEHLNGNYGGGIFMQDCDRVVIRDVTTQNNNSDGISWQVCDDVTVEDCRSLQNAGLGLHPGSGSQRPVVRRNEIRGNHIGFFFCWGVKHGVVEDNLIEDTATAGISIGHRDTDNLVRNNTVRRSGTHGLLFRSVGPHRRDPHRNLFEGNVFEDSGTRGDCVAIEVSGKTEDVVLRDNRVCDTRRRSKRRRRIGIRVGKGTRRLKLEANVYAGVDEDVVDLR